MVNWAKFLIGTGLILSFIGAVSLVFVVRVPIVPVCNDEGVCITTHGEILKLPIPSENPFLLQVGLAFIASGFFLQFIGIILPTKKLGE